MRLSGKKCVCVSKTQNNNHKRQNDASKRNKVSVNFISSNFVSDTTAIE